MPKSEENKNIGSAQPGSENTEAAEATLPKSDAVMALSEEDDDDGEWVEEGGVDELELGRKLPEATQQHDVPAELPPESAAPPTPGVTDGDEWTLVGRDGECENDKVAVLGNAIVEADGDSDGADGVVLVAADGAAAEATLPKSNAVMALSEEEDDDGELVEEGGVDGLELGRKLPEATQQHDVPAELPPESEAPPTPGVYDGECAKLDNAINEEHAWWGPCYPERLECGLLRVEVTHEAGQVPANVGEGNAVEPYSNDPFEIEPPEPSTYCCIPYY